VPPDDVDELAPPPEVADLVELLQAATTTSTAAAAASSVSLRWSICIFPFVVSDRQSVPRRAIEPFARLSTHNLKSAMIS
jgi:hypothetical protein